MRSMLEMAVMDTPRENSDDIEVFFNTFNKAVAEYLREPEYIWDPFLIMMDHKGANFKALECVYGENFRRYKTVTCQWHFLHCAEKYLTKCSESERESFRTWCKQLCQAHTRKEYYRLSRLIKGVAKRYHFLPWWKWWSPRCPHLCPAIRGFSLPRMNKAEIGQSKLKQERPLWITEAVKVDMIHLHLQSVKYKKFINNSEKIGGWGPNLKSRNECERAEEKRFVDQFCDVIETSDLLDEQKYPEERSFMPSARAKHKAPKYDIGIQEKIPKKKRATKSIQPHNEGKKLPARHGRGFNPRFPTHGKQHSNNIAPQNRNNARNSDPNSDDFLVPENVEHEFMKANRVYYIVLNERYEKSTKMVTYCRGCEGPITLEDKRFPNNMVFHYKHYRRVPKDREFKTWVMSKDKKNCYFHARDMGCLHQIQDLVNVEIPDVYMDNASFARLKPENRKLLERKQHLDAVLEKREKLVRDGHL